MKNSLSLGKPRRSWMFASTSNERDRPSLSLPRVQAVVDVLEAFGWRPTRQSPLTDRETAPNVLQPAILSNGTVGTWLTRLSDDHGVTQLALECSRPTNLVERLFLRVLTRRPTATRKQRSSSIYDRASTEHHRVRAPPASRVAQAGAAQVRFVVESLDARGEPDQNRTGSRRPPRRPADRPLDAAVARTHGRRALGDVELRRR